MAQTRRVRKGGNRFVNWMKGVAGIKKTPFTSPSNTSIYGNNTPLQTNASRNEQQLLNQEEFIQRMILEFGNTNPAEKTRYQANLQKVRERLNEIRKGLIYKQPGGRRTKKQRRRRMTRRRR
jgi:hypothetical protein